jgi:hypothetical protein
MLIAATHTWAQPFTLSGPASPGGLTATLYGITTVLISAAMLVSVVAVVVRFVKSAGEERLQLKWCAAAALALAVVFVASVWVTSAALNVLQSVAFVDLWTAIAVAVLKYRLYDIDRVISRTLAYAIVTGLLVGVYAALVLLTTEVFRLHSTVAVAASTLAAAALFNPLRRVQQVVDRRFNRARYDAEQTVAAFAARLKTPWTWTQSGATWPPSSAKPSNPPTYRCGSASRAEGTNRPGQGQAGSGPVATGREGSVIHSDQEPV